MRVGTVTFCTDQGLGYLALDFYKHGIITDPLLLAHGGRKDNWDWYPPDTPHLPTHRGSGSIEAFKWWIKNKSITHVLFFETPFNWDFITIAQSMGVKTLLMPMHECMPVHIPTFPDVWLCPSELDVDWAHSMDQNGPTPFIPVPVPDDVPYKHRERARVFVHNAGNGGLLGRNGTSEVLQALDLCKSGAEFIIRAQESTIIDAFEPHVKSGRVTLVKHHVPFQELWTTGDVFLFPEKFNGLSLPLQEARAAGMLVMATARYPMTKWLPTDPLIRTCGSRKSRVSGGRAEFDEAIISPNDIASKVDYYYDSDISTYSRASIEWRQTMSWEVLGPKYLELLRSM